MGQEEVLKVLKKYKGQWFTTKQISQLMSSSTVSTSLCRLRKHHDIKFKRNTIRKEWYLYSSL